MRNPVLLLYKHMHFFSPRILDCNVFGVVQECDAEIVK